MKLRRRSFLSLPFVLAAVLAAGCAGSGEEGAPVLRGVVAVGGPLAHASLQVVDALGSTRVARANERGEYRVDASGLQAPLLISAIEAGENRNCRYNASLRARCLASVVTALRQGENVANVTPLTDRIVSDVAVQLKHAGPQQLVESGSAGKVSAEAVAAAKQTAMAGFGAALRAAGVADLQGFDLVSTPMNADGRGVDAVLAVVNHNRNYDNPSSESGHTVLTDISFRPIVGLQGSGAY